ncbi:hypothetical protein FOA52_012283 [Chlamydomonas sp. UWO 241]|nr:hypothetical protein FOA52_012283 [Chlamydomonas sp. UWO 241]
MTLYVLLSSQAVKCSLLYCASGGGDGGKPLGAFVNRKKGKWSDLQAARKRVNATLEGTALETELDELLAKPAVVAKKTKASKGKFEPVTGWLGRGVEETIDGWATKVYQASTGLVKVTRTKARRAVPEGTQWEGYLGMAFEDDGVEEAAVDYLAGGGREEKGAGKGGRGGGIRVSKNNSNSNSSKNNSNSKSNNSNNNSGRSKRDSDSNNGNGNGNSDNGNGQSNSNNSNCNNSNSNNNSSGNGNGNANANANSNGNSNRNSSSSSSAKAKPPAAGRRLTSRCWMASGFPLSLHQLLPVLEAAGSANKHIAKVAKFMSSYGDMDVFPIKVEVPVAYTAYVHLRFSQFQLLAGPGGPAPAAGGAAGVSATATSRSAAAHSTGSVGADGRLPPGFFDVPEAFVKFEPKVLDKLEKRLKGNGGDGDDDDDDFDGEEDGGGGLGDFAY